MSKLNQTTVPAQEGSRNFLFDIIVTHLKLQNEQLEDPQKLWVEVKLQNESLQIRTSRINVTDFLVGRSTEFKTEPDALRSSLQQMGLPIAVRYGFRTLGSGEIMLPPEVTDRIAADMNDLVYTDGCQLKLRGEFVGTVEILCRFVIKCEQPTVSEAQGFQHNLAKLIQDKDILFVVGQPQTGPDACDACMNELEQNEGDEQLNLDLQRYRSFNSKVPAQLELLPERSMACCRLKQFTTEYEQVIDSVTKRMGMPEEKQNLPFENHSCATCGGYPTRRTSADDLPCAPEVPRPCFEPRTIPMSIGDSADCTIHGVKPPRFCPVCLTSMSWMPKWADCPKCGVKTEVVLNERHMQKLTADDIMKEFLAKPQETAEDFCIDPCQLAEEMAKREMRDKSEGAAKTELQLKCTCKKMVKCAHCRVNEELHGKKKKKIFECPKVKPKSQEDFNIIQIKGDEECLPDLAHVLSELRQLYEFSDAKRAAANQKVYNKRLKSGSVPYKQQARKEQPSARHNNCHEVYQRVPRNHAWNWHSTDAARLHGWQPGAIHKPVSRLMSFFMAHKAQQNAFKHCQESEQQRQDALRQLPILNVAKKNGDTFITLRPFNKPNVHMKPVVFQIVKSDLTIAMREIKRSLKEMGFPKCTCHRTVMLCSCRAPEEKRKLERAIQRESRLHGMESCLDKLVLTDTSESEMEFDFDVSPAAAVTRRPKLSKPHTFNRSTQTTETDKQPLPPKWPIKPHPYKIAYDCAVGDRFRGTAFGKPAEDVFEDGVFGYRGGGLHGKPSLGSRAKNIWPGKPGAPVAGLNHPRAVGRKHDRGDYEAAAWKGLAPSIMQKIRANRKNNDKQ